MKEFIKRLQKDLHGLQRTLEKEREVLVSKLKTLATKESILAKGAQLEELVEQRLKKLEPSFEKVLGQVRTNAKRAGIDLSRIEERVRSNVSRARSSLRFAGNQGGGMKTKRSNTGAKKVGQSQRSAKKKGR